MLSVFRTVRGYVRATLNTRATAREFARLGLTPEVLGAQAAAIDAATPDWAQARGKPWAELGEATAAYLALLRELPDGAGPDAVVARFRRAGGARQPASRA